MSTPLSGLRTEHLIPLAERMELGDRDAADELIRRSAVRLEHLARRMLRQYPVVRGQVETNDVIQETCIRLLNALGKIRPENTRHFFALAAQHIGFHLLDLAHRFRRGPNRGLEEHAEPVAPGSAPADVEELDRWQTFHEAVQRLAEEEWSVVGLHFYQGLTYPEIARLLNVSQKTVWRRWHSAFLTLREELGGWTPQEDKVPDNQMS